MKKSRLYTLVLRFAILLVGAALFAAPFLNPRFVVLAFVGTVPWLYFILAGNDLGLGRLLWFLALVYLVGVMSLSWLAGFSLPAWLISPLFYVPLFLPTFYVTLWLRRSWPSLPVSLIWALSFTATEWLRIRFSPGEIPFCQLGAALTSFTKLIQIADVAGATALSTIAALTAGFVFETTSHLLPRSYKSRLRTLIQSAGLVAAIFGLTLWYGYRSDRPEKLVPGPRVEIVQSNMPGWRDDVSSRLKLERAIQLTELHTLTRTDVDLIVWPENSLVPRLDVTSATDDSLTMVHAVARKVGVPILVDGPYDVREFSERHRTALIQPDGGVTLYAKQLFVPWSEYAPFESKLRSLSPGLADGYLRFIKSRNPYFTPTLTEPDQPMTVFHYRGRGDRPVVFASPVCYEVLSSRLVNRWYDALNEEDRKHFFLVNQVNEILVGDSVHNQTLAFCQLRAVEGRVSVIRGTNNGISAAIDPNGRVYDRLTDPVSGASTDVAGVFFPQARLDPRAALTFYVRFGDWWPITCLITSVVLIAVGYLRQRTRKLSMKNHRI